MSSEDIRREREAIERLDAAIASIKNDLHWYWRMGDGDGGFVFQKLRIAEHEARQEAAMLFKLEPEDNGEPPLTIDEIVDGWNDLAAAVGLARVTKITPQRRKAALARLKEYPDLPSWQAAFRHIRNTPFLRGETTDWRASFDFLVQASSFTKLVEGTYGKKPA